MTSTAKASPRLHWSPILSGPSRIVACFALTITIGAALLALPAASNGEPLAPVDALFTATSGVCITGLSTVDIGTRLSAFGQGTLLGLIQVGGLGITIISTFLLAAAGRATLGDMLSAGEALAAVRVRPFRLLGWVIAVTVTAEALGAVLLATRFSGGNSWWLAVFHSVSAFCNAGFSLFPESMAEYRNDPLVLGTISVLIMLGGIGFIVLRQTTLWVFGFMGSRRFPLFLHSRVVLLANVVVWTMGAMMLFGLEHGHALAGPSWIEALSGAIFQSISARTAGFNTIDLATLREPTLFLLMFLMLIGASPGSCGGGLKVTTVSVLFATVIARVRGVEWVTLLRRTVPAETVQRSFLLLSLTLLFLALVVTGLLFSEERAQVSGGRLDHLTVLAFEAVSAFGTVGYSAGVTPHLSAAGKLIIILCMFVGRLGPLAVALTILRPRRGPTFAYPQEQLAIG
jgi:trk system potassium uptake protein TrkH